ncbi:MAG: PEP-CTERM sorting domain-containing protein [Planctomycetaceae bacterium]
MSRQVFAALCAAACCSLFAADANAILITSNGDFDLISNQDGVSPISDIKILSGSGSTGRIYTNQVSGAPFALGAAIRTVSAYTVAQATDGLQHQNVRFADGDQLVIVSAILGSITSVAAGATTATFTAGRAFAVKVGSFDSRNPESWGGTIVAEFALKPQEDVVSGTPVGANVSFSASQTNRSSVNSGAIQQTQGVFLFREDSQQGQTPGDNLLSNVDQSVIPVGAIFDAESLIADIDQTLLFDDLEDFETVVNPGGFSAADLAVLNAYAALAGFADLGIAGTAFATSIGGDVRDFNPQFPNGDGGPGPNGDFFGTLGADNYVAVQASVPEPASVVLFGLGAGFCGLCALRRRRNAKLAA